MKLYLTKIYEAVGGTLFTSSKAGDQKSLKLLNEVTKSYTL